MKSRTMLMAMTVALIPLACKPATVPDIRMVAVATPTDQQSDVVLQKIKALGANWIAAGLDPSTGAAIHRNGMSYVAYISSADAARLDVDPEFLAKAIASNPDGFDYMDEIQDGHPIEGYTSIAMQVQTYTDLKRHFPKSIVIYPFRLDPVLHDPTYLDAHLTVEGSDILAPYFYPVGTPFGPPITYTGGLWEKLLHDQVAPVLARTGSHRIMPVLQGFTYIINGVNFAVDEQFAAKQQAVYLAINPSIHDATIFDWGGGSPEETLIDMSADPVLQKTVYNLFKAMEASTENPRMAVIPVNHYRVINERKLLSR